MAAKKTHDLAVKVGTYTVDGQEKARWLNVGRVMTIDDGGEMFLLNRTFNPAGVPPDERGSDAVVIRKFEVDKPDGAAKRRAAPATTMGQFPVAGSGRAAIDALDDDLPF